MVSVTQHFEFDCCLFIFLISSMNDFYLILFQLKYHESGMEKIVAPSDGQWNMINKAILDVGELDFLTWCFSCKLWFLELHIVIFGIVFLLKFTLCLQKNAQWWNRSQLDLFELFADATSCGRQNMRWLGSYVQFHWHGKFVHVLLNTSSWLTHKTPTTKIKFGVNDVSGFQSKASDTHMASYFCLLYV